MKFIFVLGGVMSGLGKGITASSIAATLKEMGYDKITIKKLDPYLNIDPGTMNPIEHGEVYVTDDGTETDLDLGYYYRFADIQLSSNNSASSGKLLYQLLEKERRGDYLGKTVQLIPHFTDTIQEFIMRDSSDYDFVICEIGGSAGDYEAGPFLEAIRQLKKKLGSENVMICVVTYIIYYRESKELKTKPTQTAIKQFMQSGIQPDVLFARTEYPLDQKIKKKLALHTNIYETNIIQALSAPTIYQVPLDYKKEGLVECLSRHFRLNQTQSIQQNKIINSNKIVQSIQTNYVIDLIPPEFKKWVDLCDRINNPTNQITIAMVGKYVELEDSYCSVIEALNHAGWYYNTKVNIKWINARTLSDQNQNPNRNIHSDIFSDVDGILVPGGFGSCGIESIIESIRYARENNVPYLGICLGMQLAVIEYARNVLGIQNATSVEFKTEENENSQSQSQFQQSEYIVNLMTEWISTEGMKNIRTKDGNLGGTMRLGEYIAHIKPNTLAEKIYGLQQNKNKIIKERHRHRYEVDIRYQDQLESKGDLIFSGMSPDGQLPEIIELVNHPFFIAGQFHPEFKSTPFKPHPMFLGLIESALPH